MKKSAALSISSVFNGLGQAAMDMGRGVAQPHSVLAGLNSVVALAYAVRFAALAGAVGLNSALLTPALVLGLTLGIAWRNGRHDRLAGPGPHP